jgi:hypothetical protein
MASGRYYEFLGKIPEEWAQAIDDIIDMRHASAEQTGDENITIRSTINGLLYASLKKLYPELEMGPKEEWIMGNFKAPKKSWITEMFTPVKFIANPRRKRRRDEELEEDDE